jgi:ribosomal protein S18 acetylase RimI-like enzyme
MVTIRTGRPTDLPTFWRATMETVWRDIPEDERKGLPLEVFESHFRSRVQPILDDDDTEMLVAEVDGRTAGYLLLGSIGSFYSPVNLGFVFDVWVLEARRGRGIGRELLDAAAARLRERGFTKMKLEVGAGNERARAIYATAGFSEERLILGKPLE